MLLFFFGNGSLAKKKQTNKTTKTKQKNEGNISNREYVDSSYL